MTPLRLRFKGIGVEGGGIVSNVQLMQPIQLMQHESGSEPNRSPLAKIIVNSRCAAFKLSSRREKPAVVPKVVNADLKTLIYQFLP
jgi:hypothetical protein